MEKTKGFLNFAVAVIALLTALIGLYRTVVNDTRIKDLQELASKGVKSPFDAYMYLAYGQTVKDRISGCLVPCDEPW